MSLTMSLLVAIGILILCIAGLLAAVMIYMLNPTRGRKIEKYENPQQALLVIDIQEDYTGTAAKRPFPYKNSENLIASVNALIDDAARKKVLIVYIRQEFEGFAGKLSSKFFGRGTAVKGSPGAQIDKRISIRSSYIFPKPVPSAFANPHLDEFLIAHRVNELFLVGLDAAACVHFTAKGALNRGYAVNIVTDAIALQAEHKWEKLLRQYQAEGIVLISSGQFLGIVAGSGAT
jgi:nicotinamidase/pyrazinamidase